MRVVFRRLDRVRKSPVGHGRARSLRTAPRGVEVLAERGGEGPVPLLGGVLVDQRGAWARVAEPGHEFLSGRALDRSESTARGAKVVKVGTGHASRSRSLGPDLVEVAAAEPAALRADENEAVSSAFGVAVEMIAQFGREFGGERQTALASAGSGIFEDETALVRLH